MRLKLIFGALVLTLGLVLAPAVYADETVNTTDSSTVEQISNQDLEGIEVEDVTKMPSRWGLWWRGIKERVSVISTFDPVKKAEKQLKFAEERMRMADYIAANATDDKKKAWAEKMVEKSNTYMEKVEKSKEKWSNNPNAAKQRLFRNIATFEARKDRFMDKIEKKIPEEKMDKFQELRNNSAERGQRVMKALENKNVPLETKQRLRTVREKVGNKKIQAEKKTRDINLKVK